MCRLAQNSIDTSMFGQQEVHHCRIQLSVDGRRGVLKFYSVLSTDAVRNLDFQCTAVCEIQSTLYRDTSVHKYTQRYIEELSDMNMGALRIE